LNRPLRAILWFAAILGAVGLRAQNSADYIIAARRAGVIEFVDPTTLKTVSSIAVDVRSTSTGLNGVFANPDGRTIYVEGPIGPNAVGANNCCWLYSIDLATLEMKKVADVWGTHSRKAFVSIGPGLLQPVSSRATTATNKPEGNHWQPSPDGRWWFGLRNGPAADLYDVARGEIAYSFTSTKRDERWWSSGTWLGNQFYIYATHGGSGRLWELSPQSTQLGDGIPVSEVSQVPGCSVEALTNVIASGDRLLVYEIFGGKIDRRIRCENVPGGASLLERGTGQLTSLIAPMLYFSQLVPNRAGSEIYGITSESPNTHGSAELVRIDIASGNVMQSRLLDPDYWWIAVAPLRGVHSGDVSAALAIDNGH
jgi:hypothetical protein